MLNLLLQDTKDLGNLEIVSGFLAATLVVIPPLPVPPPWDHGVSIVSPLQEGRGPPIVEEEYMY